MVSDFLSVCISCVFALLFFFFKILVCLFSLFGFLKRKRTHELGGRVGSGKSRFYMVESHSTLGLITGLGKRNLMGLVCHPTRVSWHQTGHCSFTVAKS